MINEIIEMFRNLTTILWVSQICGFIGLIFIVISYQLKKEKFIFISLIGLLFLLVEQGLANVIPNFIATVIGCLRNLLMFYYLRKKNKELPFYDMAILLILMWVSGLVFMIVNKDYLNIINYIPLIGTTIQTVSQNSKNYVIVKIGLIAGLFCYASYYYLNKLPVSFFRESTLLVSAIVSLIILLISISKKKNEQEKLNEIK